MKKLLTLAALSLVITACSASLTKTYEDPVNGFRIEYPASFRIARNDEVITDSYQMTGTSFIFPDSYKDGNTLREAKMSMAVTDTCERMDPPASKSTVTIDGETFVRYDWSGVGAGNLYQGTTYYGMHANKCYIATLYMHSCNLGPDCEEGHTEPFDEVTIQNAFEDIIHTLTFL